MYFTRLPSNFAVVLRRGQSAARVWHVARILTPYSKRSVQGGYVPLDPHQTEQPSRPYVTLVEAGCSEGEDLEKRCEGFSDLIVILNLRALTECVFQRRQWPRRRSNTGQ
jgi:hypothetical protein